MKPYRPMLVLGGLLAMGACASAQKVETEGPFKVSRERFYPSLKVVAVAPTSLPIDLEDPEPVRQELEALLEDRLRSAGLTVVPAAEVGPILHDLAEAVGGVYDPFTGKEDETRAERVKLDAARRLAEKYGADAVLRSQVVVRYASIRKYVVHWDGIEEDGKPVDGPGGFWNEFWRYYRGRVGGAGSIPALSLEASISDLDGQELYSKRGGLQVLGRFDVDGRLVPVPRSMLLVDRERSSRAVHLALDDLLGH